mgnify:CR=1 FL=1
MTAIKLPTASGGIEPFSFSGAGVINAAPHSAASNPQAAGTALKSPLDMQKVAALRAAKDDAAETFDSAHAAAIEQLRADVIEIRDALRSAI